MTVEVGEIVEGRYRVVGALGEGGMGRVMLAEHVLIKRKVALKILHSHFADDATVLERFMNEARAAGTLGHPNIVESTDMGVTRDGIPYIAFEYLEGCSLTDEIYRLNGLGVRRALRIAYQVAIALDAAHQAGVIHRDLKSDNIFLTDRDGRSDHVKVLDFGVSRFLESAEGGPQVLGTPEYMAPEQITAPETVDARTDVYGLGVILYEMLTGTCPFRDENQAALLERVVAEAPPPIPPQPGLPAGLSQMVTTKLLAKDPAHRYASMNAVASALEAFDGILAPASGRTPLSIRVPDPEVIAAAMDTVAVLRPPAPQRRGPSRLLPVAALAIGAGAAAWWFAAPTQAPVVAPVVSIEPALAAEATSLGTALEASVRALELQANGIASAPMLRAAIETDAATLVDMAADQAIFNPRPGEALEIFQHRPGALVSLMRLPAQATALPALAGGKHELGSAGPDDLRLVVSSPIRKQSSEIGGAAVLASTFPLAAVRARLAKLAVTVSLTGLAAPIVLGTTATDGERVVVPVPLAADLGLPALQLEARAPTFTPPPAAGVARIHRLGPIGLGIAGGLLFGLYAVSLLLDCRRR